MGRVVKFLESILERFLKSVNLMCLERQERRNGALTALWEVANQFVGNAAIVSFYNFNQRTFVANYF